MTDMERELQELRSANDSLREQVAELKIRLQASDEAHQRCIEQSATIDRLKDEKARYRSLARLLRLMCDNVPDMIWAKDIDNRYIFVNKAICRDLLNAATTEEPLGKNDMFFARRERENNKDNPHWHTFGEICHDTDTTTLEAGTSQQFDEYGNIKGQFLFLDVRKAPFIDESGTVIGTVGSARNVTEAKAAEKALYNSKQKLMLAMELAGLVYWEYDVSNKMLVLDDRFYQQHGTCTEQQGSTTMSPRAYVQQFVHPEDKKMVLTTMEQSMLPYSPVDKIQLEYRIICPDGEIKHILVQAWPDKDTNGYTQRVFGANQDITSRKKVKEELAASNALLQAIINNAPVRIFWKDLNLRYLGCNSALARDAGKTSPQALVGKNDHQLVWQAQADAYRADDNQVIRTGKPKLAFVEQQTTPGGELIWLRTSKVPLRNDSNEIIGVLGLYEDITERIQASEERNRLAEQNKQLQKADSLGRMAGAIAHHFNNRLQSIIVNLELAQLDLTDDCAPHTSISIAINECYSAAMVSKMMLDYLGKTPSRPRTLDISAVFRQCLPMLQAAVGDDITLIPELDEPGPRVNADENQLQQVLINLISNACESYQQGKNSIRLSVTRVDTSQIPAVHRFPVDWQPLASSYACLAVSDSGCGISPDDIDKIFDPFFSSKFTGRGLGLPVCLGIIRQLGGLITVESDVNAGSTFRVYMPLLEPDSDSTTSKESTRL